MNTKEATIEDLKEQLLNSFMAREKAAIQINALQNNIEKLNANIATIQAEIESRGEQKTNGKTQEGK